MSRTTHRRLKILGKWWTIRYGEVPKDGSRKELWGLCRRYERRIYIKGGLPKPDRTGTEIHELLHAVFPRASEKRVAEAERVIMGVLGYQTPVD